MSDRLEVLQAVAWYPPYSLGGTEVYLEGLASGLTAFGVDSRVIVPRHAEAPRSYAHGSIPVETYPVNAIPTHGEVKTGKMHVGFGEFRALLAARPIGIYHQHSWTRGCGGHHLAAARDLGFKTVITVHVPGNICLRGTMMRFGEEPCDGVVEDKKCGACWAQGRGLPKPLARLVANLPQAIAAGARRRMSPIGTALSARTLGADALSSIVAMVANADRIVAVCEWLYEALAANGVPRDKLLLNRQGIGLAFRDAAGVVRQRYVAEGPLRLLYIGRWDEVKGIDVVVAAVRTLPAHVDVVLTVYGIASMAGEHDYEAHVRASAAGDPRIIFKSPVSRADLVSLLSAHDALVAPSVWLETGPLVVLEAQAAGLFVLGSRLGGIAELVGNGPAGALVEAGNVQAWALAIEVLAKQHVAGGLPRSDHEVRTMDAVAAEMADVYRSL